MTLKAGRGAILRAVVLVFEQWSLYGAGIHTGSGKYQGEVAFSFLATMPSSRHADFVLLELTMLRSDESKF